MNADAKGQAGLTDAMGVVHQPVGSAARIVCLVPSITELLCGLNLSGQLVGRTAFCRHPREVVRGIPKLGGTKGVDIEKARALAPTHAIVNVEENTREDAAALAAFVPHLVVTYPRAPRDNLALYRLLGGIFGRVDAAEQLCAQFGQALAALERRAADWPRERVLYLIWQEPWMTLSRDTYISRTLALVGWETMPAESTEPWPRVDLSVIERDRVERVLLPSEPFRFHEKHAAALRATLPPAVQVQLIDGEMTSWYGSRAIAALTYLGEARLRSFGVHRSAGGAWR